MQTTEQIRLARIRLAGRQRAQREPRFIDGHSPYYREQLIPTNPLSFTTRPRVAQPVGDNGALAVFSTQGL